MSGSNKAIKKIQLAHTSKREAEDKKQPIQRQMWLQLDWIVARKLVSFIRSMKKGYQDEIARLGASKSPEMLAFYRMLNDFETNVMNRSSFYFNKGLIDIVLSELTNNIVLLEHNIAKVRNRNGDPFKAVQKFFARTSMTNYKYVRDYLRTLVANTK